MSDNTAQSIAKNTSFMWAGEIPLQLLTFLSGILVTNILGVQDYGTYIAAFSVIGIAANLCTLGMKEGLLRFLGMHQNQSTSRSQILFTGLLSVTLVSIAVSLFLFTFASYINRFLWHDPGVQHIFKVLCLSIPLLSLGAITLSILQSYEQLSIVSLIQKVLTPLVRIAVLVFSFFLGMRLEAIVLRDILSAFAILLCSLFFINKKDPLANILSAPYNPLLFREVLAFSAPLLLSSFVYLLMLRIDILMISKYLRIQDVGIYGVIVQLAGMLLIALRAVDAIAYPIISRNLAEKKISEVKNAYLISCQWGMLIVIPIMIFFVIAGREILNVFGSEFTTGYSALIIIMVGVSVRASTGSLSAILAMGGYSKILLANSIFLLLLNVSLNYFLIKWAGFIGAAIATSLIYFISSSLMIGEVSYLFKINMLTRNNIKKMGSSTLLIGGLIFFWPSNLHAIQNLISATVISSVIPFLLWYILGAFDRKDKELYFMLRKKFLSITTKKNISSTDK